MANVKKTTLSYEDVASAISYNPETGSFVWLVDAAKNVKAGSLAGCFKGIRTAKKTGKKIGYIYIRIKNYEMPAARVAWLLSYGEWPEHNVGFADGDTTNLKLRNLVESKFTRIGSDPEARKKSREQSYETMRTYGLKRYYGLTLDEYNAKLEAQNGLCAICKGPEVSVIHGKIKPLSVDHNHQTGAVRDLLCSHCNHMIGHASERIEVLRNAISYLEKHAISANDGTKESS